jgi:metallo-beta-lactamase class B
VSVNKITSFAGPALVAALALGIASLSRAQAPPKAPTMDELAKDNKLFLETAAKHFHWEETTEPVKIVGPLYFVGTRGLGSYLFVTPAGHILLNTGMPSSGPMIVESIRKLGFKPEDIKIIINGHAHCDHAGAFAYLKQLSGAQLAIMREDVQAMEDGGKDDFYYGDDWKITGFPPVKVDRVLRNGDTVKLGEVLLTAFHTPGHTRGSTTWVTQLVESGQAYTVVFPDGAGFNPGYRVAKDPSYPGITEDYRRTLHTLEMLKPDIWAGHHTEYFDFEGKRKRAPTEGVKAWIDPEGYRRFVAGKRRAFEDEVDAEMGAPKSAAH